MKRELLVILHDIRSTHNVGSIIRTAEGLGVNKIIFSGYTPYPKKDKGEKRLPHIANKIDSQIDKTALGAQKNLKWVCFEHELSATIKDLIDKGYQIISLEQDPSSTELSGFKPSNRMALILGNEVDGVSKETLDISDDIIEIEMPGKKESLNVSNAAAIAIYRLLILP